LKGKIFDDTRQFNRSNGERLLAAAKTEFQRYFNLWH